MLPESHPFFEAINKDLSLRLDEDPDYRGYDEHRPDIQPTNPLEFCDRHLNPHLQLKTVKLVPDIPKLLCDFLEEEIDHYFAAERDLDPSKGFARSHRPNLRHLTRGPSEEVGTLYCKNFRTMSKYAGQFYLCPDEDYWQYLVIRMDQDKSALKFLNSGCMVLPSPWIEGSDRDPKLPESQLATLRAIVAHSPTLAIWHFYPYNEAGESLLKGMKAYASFQWEVSRTTGPNGQDDSTSHSFSSPPDGAKGISKFQTYIPSVRQHQHRKAPPTSSEARSRKNKKTVSTPVTPRRDPEQEARPYRMDHKHYLQRAWTEAVQNDATFVIFSCGRYERIGIRHRRSQTLLLSEIIDSTTQRGNSYAKIQAALQTAIVYDALERQKLRNNTTIASTRQPVERVPSIKRKSAVISTPDLQKSKRFKREQRSDTYLTAESDPSIIQEAISSKQLALVSLRHNIYESFQPSSFVRVAPACSNEANPEIRVTHDIRSRFTTEECISVSLQEEVGRGATATVYRGRATVFPGTGSVSSCSVIVKMVFHSRFCDIHEKDRHQHVVNPKTRLKNEYLIYQHLTKMGAASSIPRVYGLFEDAESNTLALLMSDGGISLQGRERLQTGKKYPQKITAISPKERHNALEALDRIHRAGIRHRDIRADNVVVNDAEDVLIIDFDLSEHNDRSTAKDREKQCLQHILDGLGDTDDFYSFRY